MLGLLSEKKVVHARQQIQCLAYSKLKQGVIRNICPPQWTEIINRLRPHKQVTSDLKVPVTCGRQSTPVAPATQEDQAGESFELRNSKPVCVTKTPQLHASKQKNKSPSYAPATSTRTPDLWGAVDEHGSCPLTTATITTRSGDHY